MFVSFCSFPRSSISWVSNFVGYKHITTDPLLRSTQEEPAHTYSPSKKKRSSELVKKEKVTEFNVLTYFSNFHWESVEGHRQNIILTAS